MVGRNRRGFTLVEMLVVVGILGVLSGLAAPAVLGVRQSAITSSAITDLRAVDVAVNSSCGKGRCGNFNVNASSSISRVVPDDLKEFLPLGFEFKVDSSTFAMQLESWQINTNAAGWPLCRRTCRNNLQVETWAENTGFTNATGFTAPPTIYVSITILTRNGDVAQSLFSTAGGSPPIWIGDRRVWKYTYPVLVGVPATG